MADGSMMSWTPDVTPISRREDRAARKAEGKAKLKLAAPKAEKPANCPRPTPDRKTRRR